MHTQHTHRYNISTGDYDAWDGATNSSIRRLRNIDVFDGQGTARRAISELDVYSQFGFSQQEAREVVSLAHIQTHPIQVCVCVCSYNKQLFSCGFLGISMYT